MSTTILQRISSLFVAKEQRHGIQSPNIAKEINTGYRHQGYHHHRVSPRNITVESYQKQTSQTNITKEYINIDHRHRRMLPRKNTAKKETIQRKTQSIAAAQNRQGVSSPPVTKEHHKNRMKQQRISSRNISTSKHCH
mmetsp:Transcript_20896/g.51320  ORF Transcript_20896/g.51320 Transcript_20896/m.51320 type:complete len:138 (-) Transcript_20896:422-835(-)